PRAARSRRPPYRSRDVRPRDVELVRPVPRAARSDRAAVRRPRADTRVLRRAHRSDDARDDVDAAVARPTRGAARDARRVGRRPAADKHVYAAGLDDANAARIAGELLAHDRDEEDGYLVVEVESQRRRYGRLAAVNTAGRFFPQERVVLQAYSRLVAAALDSAT